MFKFVVPKVVVKLDGNSQVNKGSKGEFKVQRGGGAMWKKVASGKNI